MSSNDEDDVDTALLLSTLSNVTIGQRNENEQHQKDYYAHHLRDAYDQAKANRPKTTSSAYEPKKKEYMKWCNEMFKTHPNECYTVSEGSLVAFLKDRVIRRMRKTGKVDTEIGESTVNQYVNALTELYKVCCIVL